MIVTPQKKQSVLLLNRPLACLVRFLAGRMGELALIFFSICYGFVWRLLQSVYTLTPASTTMRLLL